MKLTHNCPTCGKVAQIQSEFPLGNLINYVYRCGHLELRTKLTPEGAAPDASNLFEDQKEKVINQFENSIKSISGTDTKGDRLKSTTERLPDVNVPEPTHKELYDDLDQWVVDGGLTKGDVRSQWVNELPAWIPASFYGTDNKKCSYEFQRDGVKFAETSQLNCLIADAMGLGKTVQALVTLKRNKKIATPCGVFVKGSTLFQWAHEITEWYSKEITSMIPVTSRTMLIPGFEIYIISMDMLAKQDFVEKLIALNLKSVVIDEVQNFKDDSAKRTLGLIKLIKHSRIQYKIALSGTPIKNRATEYFTILNILAPAYFPSYDEFKRRWLLPEVEVKERIDKNGNAKDVEVVKYRRLNPLRSDEFFELTSRWIIRREKHEVLNNLPALTRDYQIIEIDDPNIKSSYNRTIDLFANFLRDNKTGIKSSQLLGWLAQLRSITGQAKCKQALEWTNDFLESTDESLAIGIQHHSVRDLLYQVMLNNQVKVLKLSGEDDVYRKADIVRRFTNGDSRVLVINSLAGGVGLNLQSCAQALVLERQWNSADEEQFECRFHRNGQQKAVTITYLIAKGTIDEFFHNMVEEKRKILTETGIGAGFDLNNDLDTLLEFANMVASHKI